MIATSCRMCFCSSAACASLVLPHALILPRNLLSVQLRRMTEEVVAPPMDYTRLKSDKTTRQMKCTLQGGRQVKTYIKKKSFFFGVGGFPISNIPRIWQF